MNFLQLGFAAFGAFVIYMGLGGLMFTIASVKNEFLKYPEVYRTQEGIKSVMPAGMIAMFVAIVALAVIYAMMYKAGDGIAKGACFGVLIGIFAVGSFVIHNYVNLNIGLTLTLQQSVAYFVQWMVVGIVIGFIYRPL
ncbi:MAG TPA: hypothetical protein VG537_04425 [Candidatus Kapabacteria bacterium]|jgi:hypothetical protein|nr:hypothetical protein [Candidatus Kapabacteria bacterium]